MTQLTERCANPAARLGAKQLIFGVNVARSDYEPTLLPLTGLVAASAGQAMAPVRQILALDQRLAAILHLRGETMMAQFRLAWWRDALGGEAATGEPLADALRNLPDRAQLAPHLVALVDGWEEWIVQRDTPETIDWASYAAQRGEGLFAAIARVMDHEVSEDLARMGCLWALWDAAAWSRDGAVTEAAIALGRDLAGEVACLPAMPKPLRTLAMLAHPDLVRERGAPAGMTLPLYFRVLRAQIWGR